MISFLNHELGIYLPGVTTGEMPHSIPGVLELAPPPHCHEHRFAETYKSKLELTDPLTIRITNYTGLLIH